MGLSDRERHSLALVRGGDPLANGPIESLQPLDQCGLHRIYLRAAAPIERLQPRYTCHEIARLFRDSTGHRRTLAFVRDHR